MSPAPASAADLQERFQWEFAHLYHAIGKRVACAEGCGVLEQVFAGRPAIRLDDGRVIVETDLDCILVDKSKPASAPRPEEYGPGPFVASDDDLPEIFKTRLER